jgi:hypothetical protein
MNFFLNPAGAIFLIPKEGLEDYGGNSLVGDPLIEICLHEPNSSSPQAYERDAPLLHKTTHEPFRTGQTFCSGSNV